MSAVDPLAALRDGVEDVSRQAAGLLSIRAVMMRELPHLIADAMLGDQQAIELVNAVRDTLRSWAAVPAHEAPLCVSCPQPLQPGGYNLAFAAPECDRPTRMLGLGVCHRCAATPAGVMAKAGQGLRQFWPELRPVKPTHAVGGRA